MRLAHHLTHAHTFMEKDDAKIVLCGKRWRRGAEVWYQPWPDALWQQVDDLEELLARLEQ